MKLLLLAVLVCWACASTTSPSTTQVEWLEFDQILDHFNNRENPTFWKQRYSVDTTWWKPGGPIFIFLGGEASVEFFEFQEIEPLSLASQFGAMYVRIEHRFYGKSMPLPDYSTSSLSYLSSQQALADAANLIQTLNGTFSNPGPWVVWGCSYSGALSSWLRLKYPNLVVASVAPSGPVEAIMNFTQFFNQFFTSAPADCVAATQTAVSTINNLLGSPAGLASLSQTFNACETLTEADIFYFKVTLTQALGSSDQYQNPPAWPLNSACGNMTAGDPVQGWANVLSQSAPLDLPMTLTRAFPPRWNAQQQCVDLNGKNWIANMQKPTNNQRSWFWQKCTEFGFWQTSYPGTSPFFDDIPLEPQVALCAEVYGVPDMSPNVAWTNAYYGGWDLTATNVMFANGLRDPWSRLSITENSAQGPSAVTFDCGHCGNMIAPTSQDPLSLIKARAAIRNFLASILDQ